MRRMTPHISKPSNQIGNNDADRSLFDLILTRRAVQMTNPSKNYSLFRKTSFRMRGLRISWTRSMNARHVSWNTGEPGRYSYVVTAPRDRRGCVVSETAGQGSVMPDREGSVMSGGAPCSHAAGSPRCRSLRRRWPRCSRARLRAPRQLRAHA